MSITPTIWNGTSTFTTGSTPFGFYDTDSDFASDADKVAKFCAIRLGYPLMDVELQSGSFYAAFEEAVTVYGNEVYQWQIRENFGALYGTSLPSDVTTLTDAVVTPNLGSVIRMAHNYGNEAGSGGNINWYTGSLVTTELQQAYDLNAWAAASASLAFGDSIEIKRVFHEAPPAIVRYFDPYAGTGTGTQALMEQFGFGQYSPGINFLMMPLSFDVLRMQAIEFNDQIRKSGYSFEIHNNQLRLFPIPTDTFNLFFHYIKVSERDQAGITPTTVTSGSTTIEKINNVSTVPYTNPIYTKINSVGRQWIYQYTLSVAKEMLGMIRGKFTTIPIPGDVVTMNGGELINSAQSEKTSLLEALRQMLEQSSRNAYLSRQSQEQEYMQKTLNNVPMPIYIG
jgi:hypothetical protein